VELLRDINDWATLSEGPHIFWLNGLAGTGKSTIARTVAKTFSNNRCLGASFFFQKGGGDTGNIGKFVTSIVVQLIRILPSLRWHIYCNMKENTDIINRSLYDQWEMLVIQPLINLSDTEAHSSYFLVVDALDECSEVDNQRIILQLLTKARSLNKVKLKIFLTSRPEVSIRHEFHRIPDTQHQDFILHNIPSSIILQDISVFLQANLTLIAEERRLDNWPGQTKIQQLVQSTGGLFIWAATACRFIRDGRRFAKSRLEILLESRPNTEPQKNLDNIYNTVILNAISPYYSEMEQEQSKVQLRLILGSLVILFSPLSVLSLSRLIKLPENDVEQVLEDLHAILDVPTESINPVRLHHPSFRDYLLENERSASADVWVDKEQAHQKLAIGCIQIMNGSLKRDLLNAEHPGTTVDDMVDQTLHIKPEVQYACIYWVQHIQNAGITIKEEIEDNGLIHNFLQCHALHWLEALCWIRRLSDGIHAMNTLSSLV
jgi:hypothetical protein